VPGWWAQGVTVEYEKARGLRPAGGDRDGTYNASASKTVAVPVERLFEAFADIERWAPGTPLRERTSQPGRSARYDWGDGSTRVLVTFTAKGDAKSTVAVSHERLPDAEAAERIKAYWRERLAVLKAELG
jgi:FAD/FMN-containing dehydrogenase